MRAVRATVELPHEDADPEVTLRYVLHVPPDARRIPFRALAFFGAEPRGITAHLGGVEVPVEMKPPVGPFLQGELVLTGAAGADPAGRLDLRYRVAGAHRDEGDRFDVAVPILLIGWAPESSVDTFFRAELRVDERMHLREVFPTVPLAVTEGGESRSHAITLPVIPSLIRMRGGTGPAPPIGFVGAVDLGLAIFLGAMGLLGWRRLRAGG